MIAWLEQVVTEAEAGLQLSLEAQDYLKGRSVSILDAAKYRVGFVSESQVFPVGAPATFLSWAKHELRGKLLFPVTNALGHVIGLTCRAVGEHKYENYYAADRQVYAPVFGLAVAADAMYATEQAILVEGVFDLFAVRAATGADHVLATLTANTSQSVERLLQRYCQRVVCLYDMDPPGRIGAKRVAGWYQKPDGSWAPGTQPPYAVLAPEYPAHDPSDWVKDGGLDALRQLLSPFLDAYGVL